MIRVAIADDQQLIRAGFRSLMEAEPDIEIVGEAGTGAEAVSLVVATRPDVVLMDIRMPDGDGPWATEQIAKRPDLAGTHIVIVTTVELIRTVHVVAGEDALLSPGVTRRLLERIPTDLREAPDSSQLSAITDREREVLGLVGLGLTNDEIGTRLFLSPLTAKTHASPIMSKLAARDRVQLVVIA